MAEQLTWSPEPGAAGVCTRVRLGNIQSFDVQPHTLAQSSTQSYMLSARTEEGIKATVTAAMLGKIPGTTKWAIYKGILRWLSLTISTIVIVGEAFVAIFDGTFFDTTLGIPLVVLIGGWDVWQTIQVHRKRDAKPMSMQFLIAEGLSMVSGLAVLISLGYYVNHWNRRNSSRGSVLIIAIIVLAASHTVLFTRAYIEKRRGFDLTADNNLELPTHHTTPQAQPAQIIVQYLHKCPHCGNHAEPKPGEINNAELAARGEMQPQDISPAQFIHAH